ncbi:MAG: hypothetical protein SFU53_04400 [Terrimicrobiaceae bacterium]|nr:hypothetical protein [Terrimicrobiaceae bacterium]
MEMLWAALAMAVLAALAVTLMSDQRPKFRFDGLTASPTPVAAGSPTAPAPASESPASVPSTDAASNLQVLFADAAAEQRGQFRDLPAPVIETPVQYNAPPFINNPDYARPPAFRDIRESDLNRAYAAAPKTDRRALARVARLGGFRSPEAMATAFGYQTVDQMVSVWDQQIERGPQFPVDGVGNEAGPPFVRE